MKLWLVTFFAQSLDGVTWVLAVNARGIGGELNPLAGTLGATSMMAVFITKVVGALILATIAYSLRRWRIARLPAVVGLLGAATNLLALL